MKRVTHYRALALVGTVIIAGGIGLARLVIEDNRVHQIAKHFRCICEMHCSLIAANCKCTKPGGASDVKRMIRDELRRGHSEDETILRVGQKYGGQIA